MDLEIGLSTTVDGLTLDEIIFHNGDALDDRDAFARLCGLLEDRLRIHDPAAVLLNLLSVDQIPIDDLRGLVTIAVADGRPKGPRLCAIAVRMSLTLVSVHGTPVHEFYAPGLLACGPDRDYGLKVLEINLEELAAEPKGKAPIYFPAEALGDLPGGDMFISWFSKFLWRMNEPSLLDLAGNSDYHGYRFLWLRTFDKPVSVRLEIGANGTGTMIFKMTSGQGGYYPGRIEMNKSSLLGPEEVRDFLRLIKKARFWHKAIAGDEIGCDGAEWVLEGAREGGYKIGSQWSPRKGPFREAALFLIGQADVDVGKVY